MTERYVHLSPRLQAACELLRGACCVADVGCDHGRLTMSLLQSGSCERVVASDVSQPSLDKARRLAQVTGLTDRVSFRLGDGFSVLRAGECDAAALLGMGGTLMARMLDAADPRQYGINKLVLQPMRAVSDIRLWLHQHRYHVTCDRVVRDGGRFYQVLSAVPADTVQTLPAGWPQDFYELGFVSWQQRDPNLPHLAKRMLAETQRRLKTALGSEGERRLRGKETALLWVCKEAEKE